MKAARMPEFEALRRAGVPLAGIETPDPAATVQAVIATMNGKAEECPIILQDSINGMRGCNGPGGSYCDRIPEDAKLSLANPAEALRYVADNLPEPRGILFLSNAHLCMEQNKEPNLSVIQAVWNLREVFKAKGITLVMLAPAFKLPAELVNDVILITEPVPTEEDIKAIIKSVNADAKIDDAKVDEPKTVDALIGYLSAFSIEQSYSIALSKKGPDLDKLWALKVANLKQCAGLEVSRPTAGFESMSGNDGVKTGIMRHLNGREAPRAILWLDEIEKMIAGGSTDLSGTTQAVLEQFLYWTQSRRVKGYLLAGIPGAGKSLTCQATAGTAKCPLLRASLSTVKGGIVGSSEANMKAMLKSIDAVANGRVLMLATCNSLDTLSPEVQARFNLGSYFYDYPTQDEAAAIWDYYIQKYELPDKAPIKPNWVGREIESCCERAWMWNIPLAEAAETVVPVCVANAVKMTALRKSITGLLSARDGKIFRAELQTRQHRQTTRNRLTINPRKEG